ncbi:MULTISPECIES: flagellar biosynthesis protein FliQ [Stappiaceae]|uniref:flagellar biosynthesis protein FliQ n=1 Tax=Stappiaceae TaxID=2821832 RepID=UPI000B8BD642|nr:flagellar biosynthesis protein FliQ [Labrenzia sp. VG12]ASP33530.1 flagellar biosynthetic protein FliQ [Labrenzia sp. VG12]
MTGAEVLDVAREAVWTMILVAGPVMVIGLLVGIVIALFQALTQIQEMTLVFVPKILAIFATILVMLPFMSSVLQTFMGRISELILTTG